MIPPADHLLTLAEWEALPEDNSHHYEMQEGVLIARPRSGTLHQFALGNFMRLVGPQLPAPWAQVHLVEVVTRPHFPPCVRVPDIVVFADDRVDLNAPRLTADQVLVAVEIISPGSRDTDTVLKPVEYARAGIPHYWVIDLEPPVSLAVYHLAGQQYRKAPAVTGQLKVTEPFPLSIEIADLISRRRSDER
jgi:Uma2 family endonuclease